jgi:hypothetical protein
MKTKLLIRGLVAGKPQEAFPAEITVGTGITVEDWVDEVRAKLLPKAIKLFRYAHDRGVIALGVYELSYAKKKNFLAWFLTDSSGDAVGAGSLHHFPSEGFSETAAALFPVSLRGKRLYPKILRALASRLHATIDSDTRFVDGAAVRMWKRIGLYEPTKKRFALQVKDNPRGIKISNHWPTSVEDLRLVLTRMATEPVKLRRKTK